MPSVTNLQELKDWSKFLEYVKNVFYIGGERVVLLQIQTLYNTCLVNIGSLDGRRHGFKVFEYMDDYIF